MIRRLLKDSGIYAVASLLSRGISLFLVPFYTRIFSPGDYGIIDMLAMFASIANIIVGMEITQAIARFYPDCKSPREAQEYASTALLFTIAIFALLLAGGLLFPARISGWLLDDRNAAGIFRVAIVSVVLQSGFYFVQNLLRWRLEPKNHSLCSLVYSFGTILSTIVFVLYFRTGVIGVFYGQIVGGAIGFALGLYLCRSSFVWHFDSVKLRDMLSYSFPLVPSGIGVFALSYADRISIKSMMSLHALGIFGIGYRMSSVVGIVMGAFSGALTPLIFSKYRETETPREIAKIFRYFIFFMLISVSGITVFSHEIVALLTAEQYYAAADILPYLVLSTFLSGMYIFVPGLDIAKKTRHYAVINLTGVALNFGLNLLLIPVMGITGSALATLISSLMIFFTLFYFSQKYYEVPHRVSVIALATVLCCAISFPAKEISIDNRIFALGLKAVIFLAVAALMWKLLDMGEIEIRERIRKRLGLR